MIAFASSPMVMTSIRRRLRLFAACFFALLLLLAPRAARAQFPAPEGGGSEPSELFLKAFTAVQQGEKLESDGRLKSSLAKYRFAASVLEQIGQNNPNWQPLIVRYRLRKTAECIQKLEQKIYLQPQVEAGLPGQSSVSVSAGVGISGEDEDLPRADDPLPDIGNAPRMASAPVRPESAMPPAAPAAPPQEAIDRATVDLRGRLEKAQTELKGALEQLAAAQKEKQQAIKDKQSIEFQLNSVRSDVKLAEKRSERAKADRDTAESELSKVQQRLKEVASKSPGAEQTRKELREEAAKLKQAIAKADADLQAAAKEKETLSVRLAESETLNEALRAQRDEAIAKNELTKEAAQKIESLQAENATLSQKLTAAETQIAQLNAESVKKKEELEGMQKELTALKDQLVVSRDQNDRSATTITQLRAKLDEGAKELEDMKTRGVSNEDFSRMSKENELLRVIVMRQLKDQARRVAAKKLVSEELAKLEVKSKILTEQVELLGQPSQPLSDEERAMLKDPQVTISDSADPAAMAFSIAAVKPKSPADAAASPDASPAASASPEAGASPSPSPAAADAAKPAAGGPETAGEVAEPKVVTTFKPKVAEKLVPMALEAKDAFDRGQYPKAEELYEKLIAREPKNPYLLSNMGVVLFRQEKLKSAEVSLKKAVTAAPDDAFSYATLGIIYYRMHRYDDAIECLTKAIRLDPKNATAHNYLGITSSQKGWPEAAEDEIQKAIALNPNYADAHFNIAVIYATNQPPAKDRAQEHYKKATELGATPDPTLERLIQNQN
jgi:tetratricopeptide (TPR) repeat protein